MTCPGPFEKFILENNKEMDMKKAPTPTGSSRDRLESTESVERSGNKASGESRSLNLDTKIDWLIKSVEEMKDETVCKREIKIMIKDVVREEIGSIKKEMEDLRRMMEIGESIGGMQRSYSKVIKEKKKKNFIIIKPKI